MWILYSILSAVFAGLMTFFIKIGLKDVNPILSLAIRVFIVSIILLIVIIFNKEYKLINNLGKNEWLWIVFASIVTFLTWLFYYLALKDGLMSKVHAIDKLSIVIVMILGIVFLQEKLSTFSIIGLILIICGSVCLIL